VVAVSSVPTRVLVEHENPRVRDAQAAALTAAGFDVVACPGPAWQEERTCPLLARGYCYKACRSDVIVNGLSLGHLRVYVAQRAYLPNCPVLLALTERERARHPILDSLATTIPRDVTSQALVAAVRDAAAPRPGES
jgi:hypothetical protein